MLSSITPLGQRGRGMSWSRTVVAFWIGAIAGAVAVFSLLAVFGAFLGIDEIAPWLSLVIVAAAAALDLMGVKPPGLQRQVNEDWLRRYRDWVTGFGFGAQLGVGFATIIPTFGIWALYLIAVGFGLPEAAFMGIGFGIGRSLLLLSTRRVGSPSALSERMRRFVSGERRAQWVSYAAYVFAIAVVGLNVA
jgi:hypothetical protein